AWEQAQAWAKADQAIQASQLTDGIQTHDLLACVAAPEEDPMDATKQAVEIDEGYSSDDPPSTPGPPSSPPSSIHSDDLLPAVNIHPSRRPF
ncbi:hypothetical protein KXW09_007139, partial [Aspergillus fumigatus]